MSVTVTAVYRYSSSYRSVDCFEFHSVFWHCWLDVRMGIRPVTTQLCVPKGFLSERLMNRGRTG